MTVNTWLRITSWSTAVVGGTLIASTHGALAQVIPDNTLGAESSVVTPLDLTTQQIDGGALRGSHLFHSFLEFGIPEDTGVYFADPDSISTIFSRVTGENPSEIYGTLGVLGDADLFLLNPNGVLFGPDAELDMEGSFVGSTANALMLPDGAEFSTTNPAALPMLDIQVEAPVGLVFEGADPGVIVNAANLAVGENLLLAGGTVASVGELSAPSGEIVVVTAVGDSVPGQVNLTQTGELIDVESIPVGASIAPEQLLVPRWSTLAGLTDKDGQLQVGDSGLAVTTGDVVVQQATAESATLSAANDLILVESQLATQGDLELLAEDTVQIRDSQVLPTNITTAGDLLISGEEGVDATTVNTASGFENLDTEGEITVSGDNVSLSTAITAPEGSVTITGGRVALLDGTNIDVSADTSGGEIFIGIETYPKTTNNNQTSLRTYIAPEASLSADALTNGDGGQVIVWADEVTGFYGNISAHGGSEGGDGGFVEVSGQQHLLFRGDIDVDAVNGKAGTLLLDPIDIIITTGNGDGGGDGIETFQGDNSGIIGSVLSAPLSTFDDTAPTTIFESELEALSGDVDVILQATNNITIQNLADDNLAFAPGNGRVELIADADKDQVGSIEMIDTNDLISGDGKNITISGNDITLGTLRTSSVSATPSAQGGAITITGSGNVSISNIYASSLSRAETQEGGNIIVSGNASVDIGNLYSYSYSLFDGNSSDGGNISITSNGNIDINRISTESDSDFAIRYPFQTLENDTGSGGNVTIAGTGIGSIFIARINADADSGSGNAQDGGAISISGSGPISIGEINSSSRSSRGGSSRSRSSGRGGDIKITNTTDTLITTGQINASSDSNSGISDNGGNVEVSGAGEIQITSINTSSSSADASSFDGSSNSSGDGGDVIISGSGNISVGTLETFAYSDSESPVANNASGSGGNVFIRENGNIPSEVAINEINTSTTSFVDSDLPISSNKTDDGGSVVITTTGANVVVTGSITTRSLASSFFYSYSDIASAENLTGSGGDITISSNGSVSIGEIDANSIAESTFDGFLGEGSVVAGAGGKIDITGTSDVSIASAETVSTTIVFSPANNQTISDTSGAGGNLILESRTGSINVSDMLHSFSLSDSGNGGVAGNITLLAQEGNIVGDNTQVFAFSIAEIERVSGAGGTVTFEAQNELLGFEVLTLSSTGESGLVQIKGFENLEITNTSLITSVQEQLELQVPSGFGGLRTISLEVDTLDIGQSGNTAIEGTGNLIFENVVIQADANGSQSAGGVTISSPGQITFNDSQISSNANNEGDAGQIVIEAERLNLGDGGRIFAATSGAGKGGDITINVTDTVFLGEGVQDFEPIISAEASDAGRPGDIKINAPNFVLSETAQITATSRSTATNLEEGGSITLSSDQINLAGTVGILAETEGQSPGGLLTLQSFSNNPDLNVTLAPGSIVSASTSGSGIGGSIRLSAPESIRISGPGNVAVTTTGSGTAGNIEIETQQLTLTDGVTVSAESFTALGEAGSVNIDVANSVVIENNSNVSVQATAGSTAGDLTITTGQFRLADESTLTVSSPAGQAGNLTISADRVELDNGNLIAEAGVSEDSGSSANINILELNPEAEPNSTPIDFLLLKNESLISANALQSANGGNVTINSDFIIAETPIGENGSDIIANAESGDGGRVEITTQGLFGIEFREQQTPLNDITATSEEGDDGIVIIDTLETDPTRNLATLPEETANTNIQQSCQANNNIANVAFFDLGRGGTPSTPEDVLSSDSITETWTPLAETEANTIEELTTTAINDESADQERAAAESENIELENQTLLLAHCTGQELAQ